MFGLRILESKTHDNPGITEDDSYSVDIFIMCPVETCLGRAKQSEKERITEDRSACQPPPSFKPRIMSGIGGCFPQGHYFIRYEQSGRSVTRRLVIIE